MAQMRGAGAGARRVWGLDTGGMTFLFAAAAAAIYHGCRHSCLPSDPLLPTHAPARQVPLEAAVNSEAVAEYRDRQAKRQRLKEQSAQVRGGTGGGGASAKSVTCETPSCFTALAGPR
jgi:hypothetical protein